MLLLSKYLLDRVLRQQQRDWAVLSWLLGGARDTALLRRCLGVLLMESAREAV